MRDLLRNTSRNSKNINEKFILNLIRKNRNISRTELSKMSNLPMATLGRIIDSLLERQLIVESGAAGNARGRKQVMLELNYGKYKAIGIEISRKHIKAILIDLDAKIYVKETVKMTSNYDSTISELLQAINKMCEESNVSVNSVLGVGIGSLGPLDRTKGLILNPPRLKEWENVPIVNKIKEKLQIEVTLDFGANAAAMGEKWYGIGRDYENIVYINLSGGIGCSIINNNTLIKNNNYDAITLGHMVIDLNGEECECGNYGCLELYTCENAIVKMFKEAANTEKNSTLIKQLGKNIDEVSFNEIAEYADKGDIICVNVISKAATIFGTGLANFVNIINPDMVILGGNILDRSNLYYNISTNVASNKILNKRYKNICFTRNKLMENAVSIGAGALIFEGVFNEFNTF